MSRSTARLLTTASIAGALLAAAGLPALAATSTSTSGAATPATAAGCPAGPVATALQGNPDLKAQQAEGFYVFHDRKGYELEVTHPGHTKTVFSGSLHASKGFAPLRDVRLEGSDFATETKDHKTIVFRLTDVGYLDGFHAYGDCSAAVTVDLRINGVKAQTSQVFLGKTRANPTSVPFTIDRSKSAAGVATTPSPSTPTPAPTASAAAAAAA